MKSYVDVADKMREAPGEALELRGRQSRPLDGQLPPPLGLCYSLSPSFHLFFRIAICHSVILENGKLRTWNPAFWKEKMNRRRLWTLDTRLASGEYLHTR